MRYYKDKNIISLNADEVRRLIAYVGDWRNAFFTGDIMAEHMQEDDDDWDGVSSGNDFDIERTDDYGVPDYWGRFQIWYADPELAQDIRSFLKQYNSVNDVLKAQTT